MESLYQKQLLGLAHQARDIPKLSNPTHRATASNPVCGDRVTAFLAIEDSTILSCQVEVKGCALCEAGAGLWAQNVPGRDLQELPILHDQLENWLKTDTDAAHQQPEIALKGYAALTPVRAIKNRHKCVMLAFSTAGLFQPLSQNKRAKE